ncbi:MAG TPA: hypothetical protein PLQ38_03575 [Methanothrix sp.]|nr:hypothetical protein [Methanothrix sp.]
MQREDWRQIQKELERLYELHEAAVSQAGRCREFNSQAALFLERLEEMGADDMAYSVMDLLAGCSPKDFSPCHNRMSTKGSLERLKERIKSKLV